ncbi:F-box family protein [Rhynchospora pubera]|uniref:F-box family protein n=1 Tax=Rhynchospora pubera TaxID=906938 RepID=A0AAV8CWR5_9POAL|nr:F-box family protein [Rhynchospora pubera]
MGPDWNLLPPELLEIIAKKVTSLADYIRFRAVCHPWRSTSPPRPLHLPIQIPWLMLPYKTQGNADGGSTRLFYDLSTSKIHSLDLPETHGVEICGSSHGWFVLHKGRVTSLFNPITRATIPLPPYITPSSHLGLAPDGNDGLWNGVPFLENWDDHYSSVRLTQTFIVKKVILTSSPLDTTSCFVIVFTSSRLELAFCKIGDKCWTVIRFKAYFTGGISDFTFSNGFLYTIDKHGSVTKYDLINPSKMIMGGGIDPYNKYLVCGDGVDGDVLLLSARRGRRNNVEKDVEWECVYRVFKFSIDEELKWIEVNDVGKNVLFVGGIRHALSLSSANLQLPDWGANCLYYSTQVPQSKSQFDPVPWFSNTKLILVRVNNWTVTDVIGDFGSFQFNEYWNVQKMSFWLTPSLL